MHLKKRIKKSMAAMLSAVMLLTGFNFTAFAAEADIYESEAEAWEEISDISETESVLTEESSLEDEYMQVTAEEEPSAEAWESLTEVVGSSEELMDKEEESVPVAGADALDENSDEDDIEESKLKEMAIASALIGTECNSTLFYAEKLLYKEKPAVKLSMKIKGAKYFTLERINKNGEFKPLTVRTTKKTFWDTTLEEDENALPIYRARVFGKMGEDMGIYVTIPAVKILFSSTGAVVETARLVFSKLNIPVCYRLERAQKNKFTEVDMAFYIYDDESIANSSVYEMRVSENRARLKPSEFKIGATTKLNNQSALAVLDDSSGVAAAKQNFYRVIPTLDIPGAEHVTGRVSKVEKVKTRVKYGAPVLNRISKYAVDEEKDSTKRNASNHDLCYDDGNFYVSFETAVPSSEAELEVYRAGLKGSYKKITSQKIADLATALDGNGKVNYVVPYGQFDPNIIYDYKVAVSYDGQGGFSQPLERVCTFEPVRMITSAEKSYTSVELKWYSDGCAKKYHIYRSKDAWDNLEAARSEMETLDKSHYKRIKVVKNTCLRSGQEMEYVDNKGLELGMYHIYRIVPVNKKEADFYTDSQPMPIKAYPASPETVFEKPINLNSMDIIFSPAVGATIYKIQRTDTIVGGEPIFEKEDGVDFREWEEKAKALKSASIENDDGETEKYLYINQSVANDGIKQGKSYYYRVIACCNVGEKAVMWADEENAKWTEAHTQLAPVRDLNVELTGKSTVDNSNMVKISFKSSGTAAGQVDGVYDFTRVDHYEIASATDIPGLDSAVPMTIDGKNYVGTSTINIHEKPDTEMSKTVRGVKRGKVYYFAVRTVYVDAATKTTINGKWIRKKFVLPMEVFIYPDRNDKTNTNSQTNRVGIAADGSIKKKFYIDFDPYDTTYDEVTVTKVETSTETSTTSSGTTYFTLTYDATLEDDGYHYFTLTPASNTSTVVRYCTVTVTAKNYNAAGDVTDQLVKKIYVKDIPQTQ